MGSDGVIDLLAFTKCGHPREEVLSDREYISKMGEVTSYVFRKLMEYDNRKKFVIRVSEHSYSKLREFLRRVKDERVVDSSYYRLIVDLLNSRLLKPVKRCDEVGGSYHRVEYCELREALRRGVKDCSLGFVVSCVSKEGVFARDELCRILRFKHEDILCYCSVPVSDKDDVVVLLINSDELVYEERCWIC